MEETEWVRDGRATRMRYSGTRVVGRRLRRSGGGVAMSHNLPAIVRRWHGADQTEPREARGA